MLALRDLLASPLASSLLATHPNELAGRGFTPPDVWSSWWQWAGAGAGEHHEGDARWLHLLATAHGGISDSPGQSSTGAAVGTLMQMQEPRLPSDAQGADAIPRELLALIAAVRRAQLDRTPVHIAGTPVSHAHAFDSASPTPRIPNAHGMSQKKAHEVFRMTAFISQLLNSTPNLRAVRHVVDVGAGQGYISYALRDQLGLHVLALDSDDAQTAGAERKAATRARYQRRSRQDPFARVFPPPDGREKGKGTITQRTIFIEPRSLLEAVDEWIGSLATVQEGEASLPVLIVALHACGSLTPSIIRAFVEGCRRSAPAWKPTALVAVGCCYNLLETNDFPLCKALLSPPVSMRPSFLSTAHRHLAAQVPSQWMRTPQAAAETKLAVRKIVYRAMLQPLLQQPPASTSREGQNEDREGTGETPESRRLGKLPKSAYADFDTFLTRAGEKLEVTWNPALIPSESERAVREEQLSVLHTLRALLGPLIESLILLDRREWLKEELGEVMRVELVNLFDQSTGSGRNVALLVTSTEEGK